MHCNYFVCARCLVITYLYIYCSKHHNYYHHANNYIRTYLHIQWSYICINLTVIKLIIINYSASVMHINIVPLLM